MRDLSPSSEDAWFEDRADTIEEAVWMELPAPPRFELEAAPAAPSYPKLPRLRPRPAAPDEALAPVLQLAPPPATPVLELVVASEEHEKIPTTPVLKLAPALAAEEPVAEAPFEPVHESSAGMPPRFANSLVVRALSRVIQLVCVLYGLALLYWVWLAKDLSPALFVRDPLFFSYSLLVSVYVVSRFLLAPFYRSTADNGYRPSLSVIIPAFQEEDAVEATVDAIYACEYPADKLEVVVVDDGSTDATWEKILELRERHPTLLAIRFSQNRGKRAAMAAGIRRGNGEIVVFVDSDSVLEPDGLAKIVPDFADPTIGGVVGQADVLNKTENFLTRMQQVRYYVAFRVVKGAESLFGAVTCASGCFSAYRRTTLLEILDQWEHQRFLGKPATYGDDRALTNYILRNWRIVFQSAAKSHTIAPTTLRRFLVQQLRWKKSWLRESIHVSKFIWRKHPAAAAATYLGVLFPWIAPIVVVHAIVWRAAAGGSPLFYLMGAYVMAVLYSLYYAISRRSPLWWHGVTFVAIYMAFLVWQTYYAIATLRDTSWGTRPSEHNEDDGVIYEMPPVAEERLAA
jgi:hyaluronan synthase